MKATGIVRRVDDLGRVVIPKEIRRTLDIKEGDPLELFLEGDKICFQKYIATEEYGSRLNRLIEILKEEDFSVPNKNTVLSALELAKELLKGDSNGR
jgi:stage V sporulation protein T